MRTIQMMLRMPLLAALLLMAPANAAAIVDPQFSAALSKVRADAQVPGISGAWFRSQGPVHVGAAGVRRLGGTAVQPDDRFHIGSDTKAITATAMAALVRDGSIAWDTTLAQVLPGVDMHPAYRDVTIRQLLTMRSAIAPLISDADTEAFAAQVVGATPQQRRAHAAALLLAMPPANTVGDEVYSNGAYGLAGAIIEQVTGASWEEAVAATVLDPLGISAATGWPGAGGVDQPWGHAADADGNLVEFDPDGPVQFPDFASATGDLSMNAADLAVFARAHMLGLAGIDTGLGLDAATFAALHATDGQLSMGWDEIVVPNARLSLKFGSTGLFFAGMAFDWSRGIGAVALINASYGEAESYAAVLAALDRGFAAAAVPEPATWASMLAGFAMVGAAVRRRAARVQFGGQSLRT